MHHAERFDVVVAVQGCGLRDVGGEVQPDLAFAYPQSLVSARGAMWYSYLHRHNPFNDDADHHFLSFVAMCLKNY